MPRVVLPGFAHRTTSLRFTFAGRNIAAAPGETIAAALAAEGVLTTRETRSGAPRGPYCGMGACHECLVDVDGDSLRACLTPVREGMKVKPHSPRIGQAPVAAPSPSPPPLVFDVAVVGAGPAGMSAALAAARAGLSVAMIDERSQAGGQYFKQPASDFQLLPDRLDRQFREGRALAAQVAAAGVRHLSGTSVWSHHGDDTLLLDTPEGAQALRFRRLVLATGAIERGVPFPGWTLPGVMTTGAAQSFLRAYGVAPGRRIAIAGNGPLNLQLAAELTKAGAEVVVLLLAPAPLDGRRPLRRGFGVVARSLTTMLATDHRLVGDGIAYFFAFLKSEFRKLVARGAPAASLAEAVMAHPMFSILLGAEGDGRLERVVLAPLGKDRRPDRNNPRRLDVDVLCFNHGFVSSVELAAALGCRLRWDPYWQHLALELDAFGRTSLPHVFAAGDGACFGGARAALAAGTLAGLAIAADLNGILSPEDRQAREEALTALDRARRFQAALWRLFPAPVPIDELADDDTLICRCEEVSKGAVMAACAAGATTMGALKRATRLGMGRCQGRYCAPVAGAMLAREAGVEPAPDDFFAPRTPLRPMSVAAIAALDLGEPMPKEPAT